MTDDEVPDWLNDAERAAWEACSKATAGPWEYRDSYGDGMVIAADHGFAPPYRLKPGGGRSEAQHADARFIATARTALPAALRALAEARSHLARTEWHGGDAGGECLHCTATSYARPDHEPDCPLAAMPRPK